MRGSSGPPLFASSSCTSRYFEFIGLVWKVAISNKSIPCIIMAPFWDIDKMVSIIVYWIFPT